MAICPMLGKHDVAVPCGGEKCEWWNERFKKCSVFVIGDQLESVEIALTKEVTIDEKQHD